MRDTYEFDVQDFDDPNENKGVYARFYMMAELNEAQSVEAGRPIYIDKEYVEILAAGNANNIVRRRASDMDKRRFRREYALFKQGDNEQITGTRLSEIPWITRSQVEELNYRKIRTIEELAEISDGACNAPGMYELKRKAQAWVQKADAAAPFTQLIAENEELKKRLETLEAAILQQETEDEDE